MCVNDSKKHKQNKRCHLPKSLEGATSTKTDPQKDGSLQYSPGYLRLKVQYKSQSIRCITPDCGTISIMNQRERKSPA